MKRAFREGDWYAIPLGDGRTVPAIVLRVMHHLLDVAVYDSPARERLLLAARISDRALRFQRWRKLGQERGLQRSEWPEIATHGFLTAPMVERRLAAGEGVRGFDDRPVIVRDLRVDATDELLRAFADRAVVQWRNPQSVSGLSAIERWLRRAPGARVRLYGRAVEQLAEVARWPMLRELAIAAPLEAMPRMEQLRTLICEEPIEMRAIANAAPALQRLRLEGRGHTVDAARVAELPSLRALDCSEISIDHPEMLGGMRSLRALRLYRTSGWECLDAFTALSLETLVIDHHPRLSNLQALREMHHLAQLELRGLWQFEVAELGMLLDRPALRRVLIDIGGRRKNVELYRRAEWAYPWPFESLCWE